VANKKTKQNKKKKRKKEEIKVELKQDCIWEKCYATALIQH
jgi:hypothetical protein